MNVSSYLDKAEFELPVKVLSNASIGQQRITFQVHYQTCSGSLCLAPTTVKLPVQLYSLPLRRLRPRAVNRSL
jgi:hypothetical protein